MACAGDAESEGADIEESVAAGDELEAAEVLLDHVVVEAFEGGSGFDEGVGVAFDAFGDKGSFDEHGEQGGGHAVSHGVGDVEADVFFVESHDVVDIAADPGGGPIDGGEMDARDFGQATGQEVLLEPGGESHFLIHLGEVGAKRFVEQFESLDFVVKAVERFSQVEQGGESSMEHIEGFVGMGQGGAVKGEAWGTDLAAVDDEDVEGLFSGLGDPGGE